MSLRGVLVDCGPCPYLPKRQFQAVYALDAAATAPHYRVLMDHRFRRSGDQFYAPQCSECDACQPIRVDVLAFVPRKDQVRCTKKNNDLSVTFHPRGIDDERNQLYQRYQNEIHEDEPSEDAGAFLVADAGVHGGELHARNAAGQLLAVSIIDSFDDALSSVYCYWHPDYAARSLGTFMALAEIEYAQQQQKSWLYLGFHVAGCSKMTYKARYKPYELLQNGEWVRQN